MWHGFARLDPDKCAPLPAFASMEFFTIAYRARRLLATRSGAEISSICGMLNGLHRAPGFENPAYSIMDNWDPMEFHGPSGVVHAVPSPSDAGELLHNVNRVDLGRIANPLKAAWHELFGALALSCVDKASRLEADHSATAAVSPHTSRTAEVLMRELAEYALRGMEAVTVGEALLRQNKAREARIDRAWVERNKAQAPKGGKARGRRSRELLAAFLRFEKDHKSRSDREAVSKFLEQCDKKLLEGFARTNVQRVLYEKVRAYRRGLLT